VGINSLVAPQGTAGCNKFFLLHASAGARAVWWGEFENFIQNDCNAKVNIRASDNEVKFIFGARVDRLSAKRSVESSFGELDSDNLIGECKVRGMLQF